MERCRAGGGEGVDETGANSVNTSGPTSEGMASGGTIIKKHEGN